MKFKINDFVVVKKNIKEIDGEIVENYGGKIIEIDKEQLITVELDAVSLNSYSDEFLDDIFYNGLDPLTYVFTENDLELSVPRCSKEELKSAQKEVLKKLDEIEDDEDFPHLEKDFDELKVLVESWVNEFISSKEYQILTENQKKNSRFIVKSFSESMYEYYDLYPAEWTFAQIKTCLLNEIPHYIAADLVTFESYIPVLVGFFKYLESAGNLKTNDFIDLIKDLNEQFITKVNNSKNWGLSKTFLMSAVKQGIDITNETEMQKFIDKYKS